MALALGILLIVGCSGGSDALTDAAGDDDSADAEWGPPDCCVLDDAPPACAGLDALRCRNTAGCIPAFCPGCACDPAYLGCFGPGSPPPQCPALDCPTPACCHTDVECSATSCVGPGESAGCGACNPAPSECTTDAECQAPAGANAGVGQVAICEPITCSCGGARHCVPGCFGPETCGVGQTCDVPTGRCQPMGCSTADPVAPCPPDFDCIADACARRACTSDFDCDGFCVEGTCQSSLGQCLAPPS